MRRRTTRNLGPRLERLEAKHLLNAARPGAYLQALRAEQRAAAAAGAAEGGTTAQPQPSANRFKLFRITDTAFPIGVSIVNPVYQVLVQPAKPVPGQTYNILQLSVRNGSQETFTAADNLQVRLSNNGAPLSRNFPILTGDQQWQPGQFITFYIMTKQYYPLPQINGGFSFSLVPGAVAIPGPAGIILRVKYNPATFARTLDWFVAFGPGTEAGTGPPFGLPVTSIWQITDANNHNIGKNVGTEGG
jgi:hypothetical protein